jgi:L-asparaginase/Glu-tRNA(Gln) amidotransferase subunit D
MTAGSKRQGSRRVGLVLTGGTIGSGVSASEDGKPLVRLVDGAESDEAPELSLVREVAGRLGEIELSVRRPVRATSESLVPKDWTAIAAAARELVSSGDVDGVLVLHGTDTMAYTAAALAFMLADLSVPIVFTGANRPADQPGSDAARNVVDSLLALEALGPGVFVVFAGAPKGVGRVHLGTRVRKVRASGNAFASVGRRPVAEIRNGRLTSLRVLEAPTAASPHSKVDPSVLSLKLYPGLDLQAMSEAIAAAKTRGVVLELYPSFTGPAGGSHFSVSRFVEDCAVKGLPVVATVANPPAGAPNLYESRVALEAAGAVVLPMLPETATVKMMWALGTGGKRDAVLDLMRTEVASEMSSEW